MKVKVIYPYRGKMMSARWARLPEGAICQYSWEHWTSAPAALAALGYHLTYFNDLEYAIRACKNLGWRGVQIWKCEVRGIVPIVEMPPASDCSYGVKRLILGSPLRVSDMDEWPHGTHMAKKIRIVSIPPGGMVARTTATGIIIRY